VLAGACPHRLIYDDIGTHAFAENRWPEIGVEFMESRHRGPGRTAL